MKVIPESTLSVPDEGYSKTAIYLRFFGISNGGLVTAMVLFT
jgi:hypothetical protein